MSRPDTAPGASAEDGTDRSGEGSAADRSAGGGAVDQQTGTGEAGIDRRRAAVVLAAGLVPWAVIPYETGAALVFSAGQVTPTPVAFQPVFRYLLGSGPLPGYLLAWPAASVLYLLGAASAGLALVGREDRRVTAGLFALAGLDLLYFAVTFSSVRLRVVALPVGVAVLWLAAWASRPSQWLR